MSKLYLSNGQLKEFETLILFVMKTGQTKTWLLNTDAGSSSIFSARNLFNLFLIETKTELKKLNKK